ncbi:MAG: ATP-grasp domain-containing protein [Acidimicrobiia bacterium]|nr:ATP-grasp domain-containing protein [Acidimicrobiia bacterium]
MSILVSSVGRRASLVDLCRESAKGVLKDARVVATDMTDFCPAGSRVDRLHMVPSATDPSWLGAIVAVCELEGVDLVIPTIDPELPGFAGARASFEDVGASVMVSSPEVIRTCGDKKRFNIWAQGLGLPIPDQANPATVLADPNATYPRFFKPRSGSSSLGAAIVEEFADLELRSRKYDGVVQELLHGDEFTCDVYVDLSGQVRGVVPRQRLAVRSGEISKGVTVRDSEVIQLATETVRSLSGARGIITVQIFRTEHGLKLIEVNARVGGGYPLSRRAGVDMLRAAVLESQGRAVPDELFEWEEDVTMMRHDVEVFGRVADYSALRDSHQ